MPTTSRPLSEVADIIRSKNAGPFRITLDVLFRDAATFRAVRDSGAITRDSVARAYGIAPAQISSLFAFEMGNAYKITLVRPIAQGAIGDSDMYGCQQHVPLMSLPVSVPRS